MTVARLLSEVDSRELSAWAVFFRVDAEKAEQHRKDRDFERRVTGE